MRIVCLGGGPAGLYFAISMKLRNPLHEVTVIERNKANDTFGWGVVLSDDALENLQKNDSISANQIRDNFSYWDDLAVTIKGNRIVSSGHGFAGIGRKKLLIILQQRARELGVVLQFEKTFASAEDYRHQYDLVVATDGINSQPRGEYNDRFKPNIDTRLCKFIWLGTKQEFDGAFTFIFEQTEHGWFWGHVYQFDNNTATFIVECSQETWETTGFESMSKEESVKVCEEIFKKHLGSHALESNAEHLRGSAVWMNFPRIVCEKWYYKNVVLIGDSAATAHFSIGSGTRLAFDSAIALADYLHSEPSMGLAFKRYQEERRVEVLRLQSAARNSLEWFENIERYIDFEPIQFSYSLLTRSQRISHENLRLRDPLWLNSAENWFQKQSAVDSNQPTRSPMFTPFTLGNLTLINRIVFPAIATFKAQNGCVNDWHFTHYTERAKGGAGLICTEMVAVCESGRITPNCAGLYQPNHEKEWGRIVDFIHQQTYAKVCCQIGHAGRRGSSQVGWENSNLPLESGNWPLVSASAITWSSDNAIPQEISESEMDEVCQGFVKAALMAESAGFDMIELQAGHGYLLSSFISPISNQRKDRYGASLENRMRYPLAVFQAIRNALTKNMPISVRISAHDWLGEAGLLPKDALQVAKMFKKAGADIINVSSGETSNECKPVYGRMYQTPFSDMIRNEAHVPTMAVGNIYKADHANSILLAGRADLVCIGRAQLLNPYWVINEGISIGDACLQAPLPYLEGSKQARAVSKKETDVILRA